jgi:hypothetical protein
VYICRSVPYTCSSLHAMQERLQDYDSTKALLPLDQLISSLEMSPRPKLYERMN